MRTRVAIITASLALFLGIALIRSPRPGHAQVAVNGVPNQNIPGAPIFRGISDGIGTSTMPGLVIVGGAITAGCATGTVVIPAPLPSGSYGVAAFPVTAVGLGDRIINTTAALGTDLQTITISRCNLQATSLGNTSAVRYLVLVYALP